MSPSEKKQERTKGTFSNSAFFTLTAIALIGAVAMIVLGRVSIPHAATTNPVTNPIVNTITTPPVSSAITSTITATPGTGSTLPLANFSKGSSSAPVTVIEYSDFQCAHCQQFALTIEPEFDSLYVDTGKVRFIHKFMTVYSEESLLANEAAVCAGEQGRFWDYYNLLMEERASPENVDLPLGKLQAMAQSLNLDMDKFNTSLLSGKYEALVNQQDEEGRALGITGTPTFFINGMMKAGAGSLKTLQDIIDPIIAGAGK